MKVELTTENEVFVVEAALRSYRNSLQYNTDSVDDALMYQEYIVAANDLLDRYFYGSADPKYGLHYD